MAAAGLKIPELQIDQQEAKLIAEAVANVDRHYNVLSSVTGPALDWLALGTTLITVYGLRIAAYKVRTSREKEPPKPNVQLVQ